MANVRNAVLGAVAAISCGAVLTSCRHHDWLNPFSYENRPKGYHWVQVREAKNLPPVYYGKDPVTGDTVYVGPDNIYYDFRHPGKIGPQDLNSIWEPHDAPPRKNN